MLGQDDNERLLCERLSRSGVEVQWNTELVALEEQADGVLATLRASDGSRQEVRVAWVAGCDGAHSAVRHLTGIEFPGAPYEHEFYVADVEIQGPMVADEVNIYLWQSGFHLLFPMRGTNHWRVVGILPPALREAKEVTFESVVPDLKQHLGTGFGIERCSWFARYRIHHRMAAKFRKGRCFLLGDAAHIHSPVGAQGMNTGLQDAYNLAWKLALVVRKRASAALLETYAGERMAVARRLLATTDRGFRLVVADNPLAGLMRTQVISRVAAFLMRRPSIQRGAFRTVSQLAIQYRKSPLSRRIEPLPADAPQPGDRFPWLQLGLESRIDGTRFVLLAFGQQAAGSPALPDVETIEIASDATSAEVLRNAGVPRESWFLLRPDAYIAASGVRFQTAVVQRYLDDLLR